MAHGGASHIRESSMPVMRVAAAVLLVGVAVILDGQVAGHRSASEPPRFDSWNIIGPGGGGTFYFPAISPHDPDLVIATSDMTDSFVTENGGRTWRELNLRTLTRFMFDPTLAGRIWAITSGAGSFVSDDRGHTWRMFYPEPSTISGIRYVDDEAEPVVTTASGISPPMTAFAADPDDSNTLYAVWGSVLRLSRDMGKHWEELARDVPAIRLFVNPASPKDRREVYAITKTYAGVWDGLKFIPNSPAGAGVEFFDVAFGLPPQGGTPVLYAATGAEILVSKDGGATWQSISQPVLAMAEPGTAPQFRVLATSLHHPEVLYAAYSRLKPAGDARQFFGVAKTTDGGAHWSLPWKESDKPAANVRDSWITRRFGPDWGEQPLGMAVGPSNPDLVYTTDLGRILRSVDGGAHWDGVYSQPHGAGYTTTGLDPTTCYGVHFDPFNPHRMFISYTDIGLFRSEDAGASWVSATEHGVPRQWLNTTYWVEFDPGVRGRMWAAMSRNHDLPRSRTFRRAGVTANFRGGVVTSTDGGLTWTRSSTGMPEMAVTHILLDPKSPPGERVLYAAGFGRGVYQSTDNGKSWEARNNGLPATEPLAWRMALDRVGTLYLVTVRRSEDGSYGGDRDGWLFRSLDHAATWERVPLPAGLNGPMSITTDPDDAARLYLSAWGRYKPGRPELAEQGGVFLSKDAGASWTNVLDESRRIYDVTVDPRNHDILYAAGFEASVWRSADRGATWKRIRGFNFKFGHRVFPDPFDPLKIYITTFGSSVWHGPAEGDPAAPEDIAAPPLVRFSSPGSTSPSPVRHTP